MSILCALFGHKTHPNGWSGDSYMDVRPGAIDGIGREHALVIARCPRCGEKYHAGQIHLPARHAETVLAERLYRARKALAQEGATFAED